MAIGGWQNVAYLSLLGTGSGAANKVQFACRQSSSNKTCITTANWQTSTSWADGAGGWIKADLNVTTDQVSFYYSNDPVTTARASVTWTLVETKALSTTITGLDSMASAVIGNQTSAAGGAGWLGRIYKFAGLINGTAALDMDFSTQANNSWFWQDGSKVWNSSTLTLAGARSSTAKKVVQTGGGTWLTGYEGPAGILYLNDTSTNVPLTAGTHTVRISYAATGAGLIPQSRVSGIQIRNGDENLGVQNINAGHGGYTAFNFAADANFAGLIATQVDQTDSPLCFVELGINDFGTGVLPATYSTYMTLLVEAILTGNPSAQVVLLAMWEADTGGTYPWSQYVAVMYAIAAAHNNVRVVDFTLDWPQPGTPEGDASGYYADPTHPSTLGHLAMAGRIYQQVFGHGQCTSTPGVN
jgi:lysophospholipase L1-like esterase